MYPEPPNWNRCLPFTKLKSCARYHLCPSKTRERALEVARRTGSAISLDVLLLVPEPSPAISSASSVPDSRGVGGWRVQPHQSRKNEPWVTDVRLGVNCPTSSNVKKVALIGSCATDPGAEVLT